MLRSSHFIISHLVRNSRQCCSNGRLLSFNFTAYGNRPNAYKYCTISSPEEAKPNTPSKSTDPFVNFVEEVCAQTNLNNLIPTPSSQDENADEKPLARPKKVWSPGYIIQGLNNTSNSRFTKMIAHYVDEEGPYTQANAARFDVLVAEIKKAVPEMDTEELVNTIISMAGQYNIRDMDTLDLICRQLCAARPLNVNQLAGLANAVADLTLLNHEIISKIKSEFVEHLIHPMEWDQFTLIVSSFSRLQVGDVKLWETISHWIEQHLETAHLPNLQRCMISLAVSNLDFKLVEKIAEKVLTNMEKFSAYNPRAWLTTIYAFAMVGKLTVPLVESVLNPEFLQKLESHNSQNNLLYTTSVFDKSRLLNIAACAKYSMKEKVPDKVFQYVPSIGTEDELYWEVKNSRDTDLVNNFRSIFHKVAPVDEISKAPFLHETGVLLDGLVHVDVDQNKFVPLQEVGSTDNSEIKQVAVIYLTKRHLTIPEEDYKPRPIRQFPMQFLNLKLAGLHPVVFSDYDFAENDSEAEKCEFVKQQLLSLSDAYQNCSQKQEKDEEMESNDQ